jgi:DNA mismatch repair ATPase MutS
MLYRVIRGKVDRSYGLFVAEMLGFPQEILKEAATKA